MLGLKGDIPTESLHPLPRQQTVRTPRAEKQPPAAARLEVKLEGGLEPSQEPVYVCEVRLSVWTSLLGRRSKVNDIGS